MQFFDYLKNILDKSQNGLELRTDFKTNFSPYMLAKYFMMTNDLLPYAVIINEMLSNNLDSVQIYKWAFTNVPYRRNSFIKYIKSPKPKQKKNEK